MRRQGTSVFAFVAAIVVLAAAPAHAVVKGVASSLERYTVRLIGNGNCTGVAIARRAVITAAHCAQGMHVIAEGQAFLISHVARSAVLDDGRSVHVAGDASILLLQAPLPASVEAAPVGDSSDNGGGNSFTIAGYGTTDERARDAVGALYEAQLVALGRGNLIDPNRGGSLGASACFGDSGGPVFRGGSLVGVITRAANPLPRIACGSVTHWAPITVGGTRTTARSSARRRSARR